MTLHKPLVINGFTISRTTQNGEKWQAIKDGRQWFTNESKELVIDFARRASY